MAVYPVVSYRVDAIMVPYVLISIMKGITPMSWRKE